MEALRIIKDEHRKLWRIAITVDQVLDDMQAEGKVDGAFLGSVFDYFEQFVDDSLILLVDCAQFGFQLIAVAGRNGSQRG